MTFQREMLRLYAIAGSADLRPGVTLYDALSAAIDGGITCFQLREKGASVPELLDIIPPLLSLCRTHHVPFLVNDSVEAALRTGADGVHLGQSDMSPAEARRILSAEAIIGVTAKTEAQVAAAVRSGADYLGSGAVFGTSTKPDALPMTLDVFSGLCRISPLPIVAIGGIRADNAPRLHGSGAAGLAVVGGIFGQPDIRAAAKKLREIAEGL